MQRFIRITCVWLVVLAGLSAGALQAAAQPVEIKATAFLPKNHPLVSQTHVWTERVNNALEGQVHIDYIGGPEVIPGLQQMEALRKGGIIQLSFLVSAYYKSIFPEGGAFFLSKHLPWEERESGFYDFMAERHKRLGVMYLGKWLHSPFHVWLNEKAETPEDLKGRKLRSTAAYDRFFDALGAVPVQVSAGDTYTALERGVVEGYGWPLLGPRERGWTEVTKYVIVPPFWLNQNTVILMNLDTWNRIPADAQQKIREITREFEHDMVEHFRNAIQKEWKALEKEGVERIRFSEEGTREYLEIAQRAEWEEMEKKVPEIVPKLKELSGN